MKTETELVVVPFGDLESMIKQAVRTALDDTVNPSEWMGRDEVAEMLGYKPSYVSELVRRRGLPCHRVSGRVMRFRREEVEAWLAQQEMAR